MIENSLKNLEISENKNSEIICFFKANLFYEEKSFENSISNFISLFCQEKFSKISSSNLKMENSEEFISKTNQNLKEIISENLQKSSKNVLRNYERLFSAFF